MPKGAALPTIDRIREPADKFGIAMPEEDATAYRRLMAGPMASYRTLEEMLEWCPPQKYPRDGGRLQDRPPAGGLRAGALAWSRLPRKRRAIDGKCRTAVAALETRGVAAEEVSASMHMVGPHIWNSIGIEGAAEFMLKGYNQDTNWRSFYDTRLHEAAVGAGGGVVAGGPVQTMMGAGAGGSRGDAINDSEWMRELAGAGRRGGVKRAGAG